MLGEIEGKPAPAAPDVEHALVRGDQKLGREVSLFGKLRIVERLTVRLEIGAAVLPIRVEEQPVELAVEIVMVRNIAPRARARIELLQTTIEIAGQPLRPRPGGRASVAVLTEHDGEDIGDRAAFDNDAAIHIGFAELELGIEQDAALGRTCGEAYRHGL